MFSGFTEQYIRMRSKNTSTPSYGYELTISLIHPVLMEVVNYNKAICNSVIKQVHIEQKSSTNKQYQKQHIKFPVTATFLPLGRGALSKFKIVSAQ